MMPNDDELMTAGQAQQELGVNKMRMAKLLRDGELTVYVRDINRRIKWVPKAEVEALKKRLNLPKKLAPAA